MAQYNYKATDTSGKDRKGTIEAADRDAAVGKLKAEGLIVNDIKDAGENAGFNFSFKKKVKSRDLSIVCKQMVSILNAGVTVITALEMLSEQLDNKTLKNALVEAKVYVEKGGSLADGFRLNPDVFPPIMINMTAAGESSGSLETSFDRLSTQFEKEDALRGKIKSALTYPIMVMAVAVVAVILVMWKVIPEFTAMFDEMETDLPLATKIMVNASNLFLKRWPVLLIAVILIVILFNVFKASQFGQLTLSKMAVSAPLIKNIVIKSNSASFARTLSTLMAAGIPMLDAIEQVAKMMNNKLFRDGLMETKVQVAKGQPLSKPLRDMEVFPTMLVQMVKIGEETGNIEDMMEKVADLYDREVDLATESLTQAMEPIIMVVLAIIVGMIVAAVYGPIISMYKSMDSV